MAGKGDSQNENLSRSSTDNEKSVTEAIWREYELLDRNYSYRDRLVPYEFYIVLGVLGILAGLSQHLDVSIVALVFMFLVGLLTLYVLHLDMMSNVSCKEAVRAKMQQIEKDMEQLKEIETINPKLGSFSLLDFPELQRILKKRAKFKLERKLKFKSAGRHMIWSIRVIAICWIIFFVISVLN